MSFPQSCSHIQQWLFKDESELRKKRQATVDAAAAQIRAVATDAETLSVEQECELVRYFSRQLLFVCHHRGLDYRAQNTAIVFFCRFFICRSVVEYDPRTILLTCILLAIKTEELSNVINVRHFFEGAEGIDVYEVFRHELAVLDAVSFHLLVLHIRSPLQYLCDGYFAAHRRGLNPQEVEALQKTMRAVNKASEDLGLKLLMTESVHFVSILTKSNSCFTVPSLLQRTTRKN